MIKTIFVSFCFFLLISITTLFAQKKLDIGILAGATYYQGELNQSIPFHSPNIAGGILTRYNFDSRYAARLSAYYGTLSGSDSKSESLYQNNRNLAFSTRIIDCSLQGEFNFFEFVPEDESKRLTPYVSAGFTFLVATENPKPFKIAIPFGIGFKYLINKNLSLGMEWSYRKTFTDYLDLVSGKNNSNIEPIISNKQIGYYHQKDWYSIASIFITYKIKSKKLPPCPAYG